MKNSLAIYNDTDVAVNCGMSMYVTYYFNNNVKPKQIVYRETLLPVHMTLFANPVTPESEYTTGKCYSELFGVFTDITHLVLALHSNKNA